MDSLGLGNSTTMTANSLLNSSSTNSTMSEMRQENDRMMKESLEVTKFNNQNSVNKMKTDAMAQQANGMVDSMSKASSNLAQKAKIDLA